MITDILRTKRNGGTLSAEQILAFIDGYTADRVPDYQASALLMAIYFQGMNTEELHAWTQAMLHSGDVLDFGDIDGYKVDKHSTGGVGDKISLILAPLVAEAGAKVPMISGRGLGHTGGTLDKLESIPGFRTDLSITRFRELVDTVGLGLIGQTGEIAPADKRLYALRDVTATVECIPLIASSIMSKKLAEGIDGLVLDVKTGTGAFMRELDQARTLAQTMVNIGTAAGKDVVALITDMNQPLGNMVGNALEVIESCDVLRGGGPEDVREITLALAAEMLVMAGTDPTLEAARTRCERLLDNGAAFERFARIVHEQGGDVDALTDYDKLPGAPKRTEVVAPADGFVSHFVCAELGQAAVMLGAGRVRKEDPVTPGVGLEVHVRQGDVVAMGQPLVTLHHDGRPSLEAAVRRIADAITLSDEIPDELPLVIERIGAPA